MANILTISTSISFIIALILLILSRKELGAYLSLCIIMFTTELAFGFVEYLVLDKYEMINTLNLLIPSICNCLSLFLKGYLTYSGLKKGKDPVKCVSNLLSLQFIGIIGIVYVIIKVI